MAVLDLPRTWGGKLVTAIRAINDQVESLVAGGGGGGGAEGQIDSGFRTTGPIDGLDWADFTVTGTNQDITGPEGMVRPDTFTQGAGDFTDYWVPVVSGLYRIDVTVDAMIDGRQMTASDGYLVLSVESLADDQWNGRSFTSESAGDVEHVYATVPATSDGFLKITLAYLIYDLVATPDPAVSNPVLRLGPILTVPVVL